MIYYEGMLCKHYKGESLLEKNIYKIIALNVNGLSLNDDVVYTGGKDKSATKNLVLYTNIFQSGSLFAREYEEMASILNQDIRKKFDQTLLVQPLSLKEISILFKEEFWNKKMEYTRNKFGNKLVRK